MLPFITDSSLDPVFPLHSPSHLGNHDSKSTVDIIRPASLLRWPQFDDARVRGQLQSERVQQRPTVLSESQRGKRKVACCRSHTLFFPACACVARGMVLARSVAEQRMGTLCMSDHGRALTVSLTHEALLAQGLGLHARGAGWPMSARDASLPCPAGGIIYPARRAMPFYTVDTGQGSQYAQHTGTGSARRPCFPRASSRAGHVTFWQRKA